MNATLMPHVYCALLWIGEPELDSEIGVGDALFALSERGEHCAAIRLHICHSQERASFLGSLSGGAGAETLRKKRHGRVLRVEKSVRSEKSHS